MSSLPHLLLPWFLLFAVAADGWLGIYLDPESDKPRVIERVPGSPAEKAGVQVGDIVLQIDGTRTPTRDSLITAVRRCKPGQNVVLLIDRGGKQVRIEVVLGTRPQEEEEEAQEAPPPAREGRPGVPPPAPPGAPVPQEQRGAYLGAALVEGGGGLSVTRVVDGGPAAKAGLSAGDVIVGWNDEQPQTLARLEQLIGAARPGDEVELHLKSDGQARTLKVRLGSRPGARTPKPAAPGRGDKPAKAEKAEKAEKPARTAPPDVDLPFATDFAKAMAEAKAGRRPAFVVYGAPWDASSRAQRRALRDRALAPLLEDFVCVYVDAGANGRLLEERDVRELPTLEVLRGDRTVRRHVGFLPADGLREFLGEGAGPARPEEGPPPGEGDAAVLRAELERLRRELEDLRRQVEALRRSGRE